VSTDKGDYVYPFVVPKDGVAHLWLPNSISFDKPPPYKADPEPELELEPEPEPEPEPDDPDDPGIEPEPEPIITPPPA
jgi:protein TonB